MIRVEHGQHRVRVIRDGVVVFVASKAEAARLAYDRTVDERVRAALRGQA